MKRMVSLALLTAFVLLGVSCSQKATPKKTHRPPVYVGRVERVYPKHRYVLIALAGNVYEPGTVLISQSPGKEEERRRVANLIVTDERMGRARIPADIRNGTVEEGDLVFLYRNLAAPEASVETTDQDPDNSEPKTDEDDQDKTPPIAPESGKPPDGLVPMPGEPASDAAGQERISREREKILRELEGIPEKLDASWDGSPSGKSTKR